MSARWQSPLFVSALSVILLGGLSANIARGQCNHAGGHHHHSGFSPGLLQQSSPLMLQQQMMLRQQVLLQQQLLQQQVRQQQVQQQQLLRTIKLNRQMRELAKKEPEDIKAALKDPNADMRLVAAVVVGKSFPALSGDLIALLTDNNAAVRQAARRSLVSLSKRDSKPSGRRGVDFGPLANANAAAQKNAALKWTTWLVRQQKQKNDLKTVSFRDLALNDLLHRHQKPKDDLKGSAAKPAAASPALTDDVIRAPVAVTRKSRP